MGQMVFIDEVSVRLDKVGKPRILGPQGEPQYLVDDFPAHGGIRSAIIITTLSNPNVIYYTLVEGTTTGPVFRNFVATCVFLGYIQRGQFLVMDNARIHSADGVLQQIDQVLGAVGATRVNLPTYSPELNPCEFVFGEMKNYLCYAGLRGRSLEERMAESFASVSRSNMRAYYSHCMSVALRGL
jgi:transposase